MFGFFKKKKDSKTNNQTSASRDLFDELFPLSKEHLQFIENRFESTTKEQLDSAYLKDFNNDLLTTFRSLTFDTFGWELKEESENNRTFFSEYGDFMSIDVIDPNGEFIADGKNGLPQYRNWFRDTFVQVGGGIILCEDIAIREINAYEGIAKMPRKEATGIDYTYFLNIRNVKEQKLYQIMIRAFEGGMTGIRDNLMMHPLCDMTGLDMMQMMKLYRKDPYDKEFKDGNRMNLSERSEFDHLFPIHPLSRIRLALKPRLLKSLKFE